VVAEAHVVGGRLDGAARNLDAHHVYDPATNRWTAAPPLPTARAHRARSSGHACSCSVASADQDVRPGRGLRRHRQPLERSRRPPTPRHGLTAIALEGVRPLRRPSAGRFVQRGPRSPEPLKPCSTRYPGGCRALAPAVVA
jgi:hypothetical protein